MKKSIILLAAPLLLASCTLPWETTKTPPVSTDSTTSTSSTNEVAPTGTGTAKKEIVAVGDTVAVDYVGRLEDGTIFDSSIEEFAKQKKGYTPGRTFEPLSFTVGAGQMIKGFDNGVIGMKLGEKKTITIAPKDAYGEAYSEQEVLLKYFQDIFTQTVPRENFQDVITQTVPLSALGEQAKDLAVGQTITAGTTKAKVTKIEGDNVTLDIENSKNPFFGKKLAVGLKGDFEGSAVTIKKIDDKELTLEVKNASNPFQGKKLAVGLESTMKDGSKVKILAINGDTVTIGTPNTHELAGKTLKFDVEIKSIK